MNKSIVSSSGACAHRIDLCQKLIPTRLPGVYSFRGELVIHRRLLTAKPELESVHLSLQWNFRPPFADRVQRPAFERLRVITPNLDVAGHRFQESGGAPLGFKVLERNAQS